MSRRASNAAGGGVSLFPFLSILACLIGILTLMIKLISDMKTMEHSGKQDEKQVELAREFQAVKSQIKKAEKESAEITESMRRRSAVFKEMDDLEERRVVLKRELADKGAATAKEKDVSLQKIVERLVQQIDALRRERPALEKKLAELKAELEKRKKKPDDKPLPVRVHPGGSGSAAKYELSFLECNSTGVVILGKDGKQTPVSTAAIETDPKLDAFFKSAKSSQRPMILFLVRKSGWAAHVAAAGRAENVFGLRTGKLPIPTDGEIDLSLFTRK